MISGNFRPIQFAGADHLTVGRLQIKIRLATGRYFSIILSIFTSIGFDRFNALNRAGFGFVHLTGENDFAIPCLEIEVELVIFRLRQIKYCTHGTLLGPRFLEIEIR